MRRREFMGAGLAGAALALNASDLALAASTPKSARPRRPFLINRPRAEKLMAEAGLDAIVVRDPSNVFYASNHWSLWTDYGSNQPLFAVIPRQADRPVVAVIHWVAMREMMAEEYVYGPAIVFDPRAADKSGGVNRFQNRRMTPGVELSPLDAKWMELTETLWPGAVRTHTEGIAKALKELGLSKGRVGVDDARIQVEMGHAGYQGAELVDALPVMLRIRQVKTAPEIELARRAAQVSADAALAAVRRADVGATRAEIRQFFREEAAKRGGGYVSIMVGWENLPNYEVERGQPFMIDAVASVDHYVGDFGRTIVFGEPSNETKRICASTATSWEAIFEGLRPGMRSPEVAAIGRAAVARAGMPIKGLGTGAHSVGMQHSEDPIVDGAKETFVFEPGMVISVDHPYIEMGWGSSHLEDVSLITATGAEALNTHTPHLVIIPA